MENVTAGGEPEFECEWEEFGVELAEGDPDAEPDLDLGPCCACRQPGKTVRNLLMLPLRAPASANPDRDRAQGGWGCVVCHLPCEGAVAVLCDRCSPRCGASPRGRAEDREVLDVCDGYPALGRRTPRAGLTEPWDHDYALHPETWQAVTGQEAAA